MSETTLIFAERRGLRRVWVLAALLIFSVLAHAACFYIIQVSYTPTVTLAPPPAQVALLAPLSPENRSLENWLAVADPALMTQAASGRGGNDLAALSFHYAPSYAVAPPAYRPVEVAVKAGAPPAGNVFDAAPLPPPSSTAKYAPPPSPPSCLTLGPELAASAPALPPIMLRIAPGAAAGLQPLAPSVFLVGARTEGGAPFVFRQASSGNAAADDYAREFLVHLNFRALDEGQSAPWGLARFAWGADVFR